MNKKVLAFGASNSKTSINKALATYAASKLNDVDVIIADLNDYELPLYSPELERENGVHAEVVRFYDLLDSVDGLVIWFAEYNGNYTPVFKNLFDWVSRIEQKVWKNKPMLAMSTSPGGRGGAGVLNITKEYFPHFGGNIVALFSLPVFQRNFQNGAIINEEKEAELSEKVYILQQSL